MSKTHGIAIIGCGTVGGYTAEILIKDKDLLTTRTGTELVLKYIVDRDFSNARKIGLPEETFCEDLEKALADPDVETVVELVGGTTIAKTFTEKALTAGKHVVTANKALLAHYGTELMSLARENGVSIAFEASCGGGIPIIRALYDGLIANRIDALYGIVNGTCNYILTEMIQKGQAYADALKEAQEAGLAEADPTLDVSGGDSAHKIAIMAALAFGKKVDFESIPVSGIDELQLTDVAYGEQLGYVVKLLAVAHRFNGGICLRVRPAFISKEHPLAWISGPFNAVSVYGSNTGHTMYYGRGAGGAPTSSAVVADIASIATGVYPATFSTLGIWPDTSSSANQVPVDEISSRYYLRLTVDDKPGVLAEITSILGKKQISISSMLQPEPHEELADQKVPIVITTHEAVEKAMKEALSDIDTLPIVHGKTVCISIVDEHPENM